MTYFLFILPISFVREHLDQQHGVEFESLLKSMVKMSWSMRINCGLGQIYCKFLYILFVVMLHLRLCSLYVCHLEFLYVLCRRAFRDELALLQQIRHPNVVQFLGAVTQSSPMMIVTEYLPKVVLLTVIQIQIEHIHLEVSFFYRGIIFNFSSIKLWNLHHSKG